MSDIETMLTAHRQEIRRGSATTASLALLRTPQYGNALISALRTAGLPVDGNTLYPLLRRLEEQGMLTSAWDTSEARPRKYYEITAAGQRLLTELIAEWGSVATQLNGILTATSDR